MSTGLLWGTTFLDQISGLAPAGTGAPGTQAAPADGNAMPIGGYLLPCIPAGYLDNPTNEAARLAALDAQLEGVRTSFDAFLQAHNIHRAVGADLDNLGALVGVARLAGETDEAYRVRIPATVQHGVGAVTQSQMLAYLQAATGVPVVVADTAVPGRFSVTFLAPPPQGSAVVPLIAAAKALGMDFIAVVKDTSVQAGRLGTFRLGEQALGGGRSYVVLKGPTVVSAGGATARLGAFRLGTRRLSDGTSVIWN